LLVVFVYLLALHLHHVLLNKQIGRKDAKNRPKPLQTLGILARHQLGGESEERNQQKTIAVN